MRIPVYSSINRKKALKISKRFQQIGKRIQPTDALAGFENSNEIQKLFEYHAKEFFKMNKKLKGQNMDQVSLLRTTFSLSRLLKRQSRIEMH